MTAEIISLAVLVLITLYLHKRKSTMIMMLGIALIIVLSVMVGVSMGAGSPTADISIGKEYLLIGMSRLDDGSGTRYLLLLPEEGKEAIFYKTSQYKLPPPQPTPKGVLTPGDVISVLNNGNITIVKDYPPGCSASGCG